MANKFKFTKEEIIKKSYEIVDKKGIKYLTARTLGESLDSSSKIVFGLFEGMNDLKNQVIQYSYEQFAISMKQALISKEKIGYIACGLAYINLAKNHPNIFKLILMRNTSKDTVSFNDSSFNEIIKTISKYGHISIEGAKHVHLLYWFFMHGIACQYLTNYYQFDDNEIEDLLSEAYLSLIENVRKKEKKNK